MPPTPSTAQSSPRGRSGRSSEPAGRDAAPWDMAVVPRSNDLVAARAFCRDVARRHYENFTVATRLLPERMRQDIANVYAFARWADDLADEQAPEGTAGGLAEWRQGLEACFAGRPNHPIYTALAETVERRGLPQQPFFDLLAAFEEDKALDLEGVLVRYATRTDLLRYCSRSANPVGRIVLALEGCHDPTRIGLSDDICTGLQLVNFWQDVCRDFRARRIYLPAEDLARHGVAVEDLTAATASPRVRDLLRDEVAWARHCLNRGAPLAEVAPPALRPAIRLFAGGGLAVADAIERCGYDTLAIRPVVGRWTKAKLAARAWWQLQTGSLRGSA